MKACDFSKWATNDLRTKALQIAEAGIQAIDTNEVIERSVTLEGANLTVAGEHYDLDQIDRVLVAGIGKCSLDAAYALERILGDLITDGVVVDVRCGVGLTRIQSCEGTHPMPSEGNIQETSRLVSLLESAGENDLVLFIISGGGSTLMCQPATHTCFDEQDLLKDLFAQGATISEVNTIRKHLSYARGGWLAKAAHPAQLVSLIFSDVPGDDLATIASGPTVLDNSTIVDAIGILDRYGCPERVGFSKEHLFETPKKAEYFSKTKNKLVLTNKTALEAMQKKAESLGLVARVCGSCLVGEAREVGMQIVKELRTEAAGTVLLYGGETTVTIRGQGTGGRNQEMAMGALRSIQDGEVFIALASDGRDNSAHSGAIVDNLTLEKIKQNKLDLEAYLADNNSFGFFQDIGDGLSIGYTGSNVADLMVALKQ